MVWLPLSGYLGASEVRGLDGQALDDVEQDRVFAANADAIAALARDASRFLR